LFNYSYGSGFVYETLKINGNIFRFRISPHSFFQTSTEACEILYSIINSWIRSSSEKVTLLDLCCGTGTIGICCSRNESVDKIIGIELCAPAIDDARFNSTLNNVEEKVTYICDKVESVMSEEVLGGKINEKTIAILDPPRSGVKSNVISAIRNSSISKVIYISCKADAALPNWIALCRPSSKKFPGQPFKLTRTTSCDLFPQTEHYEMILEFSR
jgi:tRNA (uracil-5-)-methyltransferase